MAQQLRKISFLRMVLKYWSPMWAFVGLAKAVFAAMEDREIDSKEEVALTGHFVHVLRQVRATTK
jgi:hypothetical protein|tara:strand:+ start:366 stop:560 length:195 start_codon:yes stop_codon:yes gene_type:complete